MPPRNPLELPEITGRVASFLENKDLASCVCTSKSWRDMFLPYQWRVVEAGTKPDDEEDGPSSTYWFGPYPENIDDHRHFIRNLSLSGAAWKLEGFHYPALRSLTINFHNRPESLGLTLSLDLTETCPLLAHLALAYVKVAPMSWTAMSTHSHIKSLKLWDVHVETDSAPLFWKACQKLENLEMGQVIIEGGIPEEMVLDRMRKLTMTLMGELDEAEQMDLILQSPHLEFLIWEVDEFGSANAGTLIRRPIQNNHWPHLDKLHIGCDFLETDLASLLGGAGHGLGNIVDLRLSNCQVGPQTSKALSAHFETLVKVDIIECYSFPSSTILDIMRCCPRLEVLQAKNVFAREITDHGPWACQQLRELTICFRVEESERDLHQVVFERLSTLVRLEKLRMWIPSPNDSDEGVLEFRLDCGLGQLASLQQLTTLAFSQNMFTGESYTPQFDMEEVAWMVEKWKKLERVVGSLNRDTRVDSQLRSVIKSRGIATTW
ncbi:hypothetical protein BGX34_011334 [Mortierella sp. NVP85]|nr:hypothetical protein BGX34_011334 [Mortierella sp. NVP85]